MDELELTQDRKRLLYLIAQFSKPSDSRDEDETWIKKIPLMALIYFGIKNGILVDYDYAPTLVDYMGTVRFANISKEGEADIADLRVEGLLKRLKLATSHHIYVSAYRITPNGLEYISSFDSDITNPIDALIKCKTCAQIMSIEARDDSPYMVCKSCKEEIMVDIFNIRELAYVSRPIFSDIWLPID